MKDLCSNKFCEKVTARWKRETHTSCHPWKVCSHLALIYQPIQITQNQLQAGHVLPSVQPEVRAREESWGTEEKCTWQMKEATHKPAHHNHRKGIGNYCGRGMGRKAKGNRASLEHAHRTTFLDHSNSWSPPSSFILTSTTYAEFLHWACKTLNWGERSTPYIFKLQWKIKKSLCNNTFPKDVNIQRDNFQKETGPANHLLRQCEYAPRTGH